MKLIAMVCPQCGAAVEADEYSTSVNCKFCNMNIVIQQKSNNYHDESLKKAELFIREHKDYKKAKSTFEMVKNSDPRDPRPWIGLIRCLTRDFTEKMYIAPENYAPFWLDRMEENLLFYFSKYEQLEKKQDTLQAIKVHFDKYVEDNRKEFEELASKFPEEKSSVATYDTTISSVNKVISSEDIKKIIEEMKKTIDRYKAIGELEAKRNFNFDYDDEEYYFKDNESKITFHVNFTDSTESKIDDYDTFMDIFEKRLKEIKYIYVSFNLNYQVKLPATPTKEKIYDSTYQTITLTIYENKFDIETRLKSEDRKVDNIYNLIKKIVNDSPTKYDNIIKKRGLIQMFLGISYTLVPSIVLTALILIINESIRDTIMNYAYLYPFISLGISFALSSPVMVRMTMLYKSIIPEQKYAGYKDHKSVYTDDVESFISKSEVTIGKNYKNLEIRKSIQKMLDFSKKIILPELGLLVIVSIIVFIISLNY